MGRSVAEDATQPCNLATTDMGGYRDAAPIAWPCMNAKPAVTLRFRLVITKPNTKRSSEAPAQNFLTTFFYFPCHGIALSGDLVLHFMDLFFIF